MREPHGSASRTGSTGAGFALADRNGHEAIRGDAVAVTVTADPDRGVLRRWDGLVAATPGADVAQLSAWANVRRQAGFRPILVLAEDAKGPVGGALVLHRRLPALGSIGYLPLGPVLPAGVGGDRAADAVCAALAQLADHRLTALFVQPPAGADRVSHTLHRLGFRPSTAGIAPAATLELDLSQPVDRLRRGLRSGTRGNIRQAANRGVVVRIATAGELPVVSDLLSATAAHHRFPPVPLSYLRTLYQQLEPDGHLKIFVAEHDGVPVAAQVLTSCGEVVKLRLTGLQRSAPAANGAAALLQWETIQWAKETGHRLFDFGGIAVSAVDAVRAGPAGLADRVNGRDYFKASFGGRPVLFPQAVERFSGPTARIGYDLALRSHLGRHAIRSARQFLRAGRTTR